MTDNILSPWPSYSTEDAEVVSQVILSNKVNYWTGSECRSFEEEFAAWCGCEYAVAIANGSLALEAALVALDVGTGDEVIVTARTFIASVSSIVLRGATPVFADVELDSQNLSPQSVRELVTERTKAVMCVHLAGWPCDMDEIIEVANEHGLYVIEDCAQAHGAYYKGKAVGSIGDIAAWSFCQDKIMTTGGEGGMVTTNDHDLWQRVWSYKDHGKSWDAVHSNKARQGFRWLHTSFGSNWRMTEMQAALGRLQLKRMPSWHASRKHNAEKIRTTCREFSDLLVVPDLPDYIEHAWYKCYVFVRPGADAIHIRDSIMHEITEQGIPCYSGICPEVYRERAFDSTPFRPAQRLPNAHSIGERSLMFLVHPTITVEQIERCCDVIKQVVQKILSR